MKSSPVKYKVFELSVYTNFRLSGFNLAEVNSNVKLYIHYLRCSNKNIYFPQTDKIFYNQLCGIDTKFQCNINVISVVPNTTMVYCLLSKRRLKALITKDSKTLSEI